MLHKGNTEDGVYGINPDGNDVVSVFCDQQTNGGGWIVLQRRLDGSVDFYRDWSSYKRGFGDLTSEFWLGNDNIHKITSKDSQLLIELTDFDNLTAHAVYDYFHVATETEKYAVQLAGFSGTAGDSMLYHNGMMFSTKDQDNDPSSDNCAEKVKGAWWYNNCRKSNLNGVYRKAEMNDSSENIKWGSIVEIKRVEMKIKPTGV